jgi:hypothetical protein
MADTTHVKPGGGVEHEEERGIVANVGEKAQEMASTVGEKVTQGVSAVAGGMQSLGSTIREKAPHSGMMGATAATVADSLERGGRYLEEEGLQGLGEDMTEMIRKNPIPALLIGFGLGFLLARATRS